MIVTSKSLTNPRSAILLATAILLGGLQPASAALPCGAKPEIIPAEFASASREDAEQKSDAILQAKPSEDLRKLVTTSRNELRHEHPKADATTVDQYLLWFTCQKISNDETVAPTMKFDSYSRFYRLMSEPIKATAPHSE